MNDTIFAPATAAGRGAVAILRLSGPGAAEAVCAITRSALPEPRRASLRRLRGEDGEVLDEALALWMPGPRSFTGEDGAELHVHGGPAIVAAVADRLGQLGLRLAEPGEFTRRAFEHGRLDLSQAEAIADLVEAETLAQRRQALAQYGGALSLRYEEWREGLLDALALADATIDFPDEDVPEDVSRNMLSLVKRIAAEIAAAVADSRGERVREGFRVALVGAPNVGKSSLLNALVGRDAAIVTDVAGTTRDVIEVSLVLDGLLVFLADMAGLRSTEDAIEAEGVRRARSWADAADLRLGIVDTTRPDTAGVALQSIRQGDVLVLNKADLAAVNKPEGGGQFEAVATVATPVGVMQLRQMLTARLLALSGGSFPAVTRSRHRGLLQDACSHLQRGIATASGGVELVGEDIRMALRSLEQVTGRSNPEAVLDRVFSSFCIGK